MNEPRFARSRHGFSVVSGGAVLFVDVLVLSLVWSRAEDRRGGVLLASAAWTPAFTLLFWHSLRWATRHRELGSNG
jgi:hypothetical protein